MTENTDPTRRDVIKIAGAVTVAAAGPAFIKAANTAPRRPAKVSKVRSDGSEHHNSYNLIV